MFKSIAFFYKIYCDCTFRFFGKHLTRTMLFTQLTTITKLVSVIHRIKIQRSICNYCYPTLSWTKFRRHTDIIPANFSKSCCASCIVMGNICRKASWRCFICSIIPPACSRHHKSFISGSLYKFTQLESCIVTMLTSNMIRNRWSRISGIRLST